MATRSWNLQRSCQGNFYAQGGAICAKRTGKRLSPTPKKIRRALATKDSPRISQRIPENTFRRQSQKSFSAFPRLPLTSALCSLPTPGSSDQFTSDYMAPRKRMMENEAQIQFSSMVTAACPILHFRSKLKIASTWVPSLIPKSCSWNFPTPKS